MRRPRSESPARRCGTELLHARNDESTHGRVQHAAQCAHALAEPNLSGGFEVRDSGGVGWCAVHVRCAHSRARMHLHIGLAGSKRSAATSIPARNGRRFVAPQYPATVSSAVVRTRSVSARSGSSRESASEQRSWHAGVACRRSRSDRAAPARVAARRGCRPPTSSGERRPAGQPHCAGRSSRR